jgi:hypothetical protein
MAASQSEVVGLMRLAQRAISPAMPTPTRDFDGVSRIELKAHRDRQPDGGFD